MSKEIQGFMQGNVGVCCRSEHDLKRLMSAVDDTVTCDIGVWDGKKRNVAAYDSDCNSVVFAPRAYFVTHNLLVISADMV